MNYGVTKLKVQGQASDENKPYNFEISFKLEADMQVFPTIKVKFL